MTPRAPVGVRNLRKIKPELSLVAGFAVTGKKVTHPVNLNAFNAPQSTALPDLYEDPRRDVPEL